MNIHQIVPLRPTSLRFAGLRGGTLRMEINGSPRVALMNEVNESEVWWRCTNSSRTSSTPESGYHGYCQKVRRTRIFATLDQNDPKRAASEKRSFDPLMSILTTSCPNQSRTFSQLTSQNVCAQSDTHYERAQIALPSVRQCAR